MFEGCGDLASAFLSIEGENRGDLIGSRVDFAGDVDGDGLSDVVLGSWSNHDRGTFSGKVYLLSGNSLQQGRECRFGLGGHVLDW